MNGDWLVRLKEAVESDPRSMREISVQAGRGVNYVQQCLKDGKAMSVDKLISVLDVLGSASTLYVIAGIRSDNRAAELFSLAMQLDPPLLDAAMKFFRDLQAREDAQSPQSGPPR